MNSSKKQETANQEAGEPITKKWLLEKFDLIEKWKAEFSDRLSELEKNQKSFSQLLEIVHPSDASAQKEGANQIPGSNVDLLNQGQDVKPIEDEKEGAELNLSDEIDAQKHL